MPSTEREAAKAELQEALNLNPNLLWARFYLAKVYIDLGKYDRAREELQRGAAFPRAVGRG